MSENNEGEDILGKGNEWEVVALTQSVYAASPGPHHNIRDDDHISSNETANALFTSSHVELSPEYTEKYHVHDAPQLTVQQGSKYDEDLHIEGLIANEAVNIEQDKLNEQPNLPCELGWRRQACSLYDHLKHVNPYWSVVVTATVMGLAIIGHRCQRAKPPVFQLKSQLILDSEGFID